MKQSYLQKFLGISLIDLNYSVMHQRVCILTASVCVLLMLNLLFLILQKYWKM